ncbi:hypothetical protein ACA910_002082 [Epithemia clementina (nom. ined.)]
MTKVHFQLPTPEELHWERTRRGFIAREQQKLWKEGKLPMRKIKVKVVKQVMKQVVKQVVEQMVVEEIVKEIVEVEDYDDIDQFLDDLLKKDTEEPENVKDFIEKTNPAVVLQLGGPGDWHCSLRELKDSYRNSPEKDYAVSKWLQEARRDGDYPFPDSKDETDAVAIAGANRKPAEHNEDGDHYFDKA